MPNLRCAIYTRKSSEEGLEQEFNSLDAQREACAAYIQSQRHEGWIRVPGSYDDGGFSGGNIKRPGLVQLLDAIDKGQVDVVVVYKVDRLTRSLSDFAKIVEAFDKKGVSFVSVTQQFNTTTSMGRLTLNVLLSFAQFEREVTGERIRDKFAASRRKGIFMGGNIPLGYELDNRKLVINERDASFVRYLFDRYLKLGDATKLYRELEEKDIRTKSRVSQAGRSIGGNPYTRGMLYYILKNRAYIGEAVHKGQSYPGEHQGIVDQQTFDRVQALIARNRHDHRLKSRSEEPSLLTGLIYDEYGRRLTSTHTNKHGRRYRYYVSGPAQTSAVTDKRPIRISAHALEKIVCNRIAAALSDYDELNAVLSVEGENHSDPPDMILIADHGKAIARRLNSGTGQEVYAELHKLRPKIVVGRSSVTITFARQILSQVLQIAAGSGELQIRCDLHAKTIGSESKQIIQGVEDTSLPKRRDPALIKALARAHFWLRKLTGDEPMTADQIAKQENQDPSYVGKIMRLAFLAPDLTEAILDGRQSPFMTIEAMLSGIPVTWLEQRRKFGA